MVMCDTCSDGDCLNNTEEGRDSINSAEFCKPMIKLINLRAKTYVCNEKIPSENIERHLRTIQGATDFWHPEDMFDEGDRGPDGEDMSEDEDEFWTIFDGLTDEIFAE